VSTPIAKPPPRRSASSEVTAYTRAVLPREVLVYVSLATPLLPLSASFPRGASARTRRGMPRARAAQGRGVRVSPPRRLLVALGLHPVVLRGNRLRFDDFAEPTVAACLRHVPVQRRHVLLELDWHGRCACLSAMASAHNTASLQRSPAKGRFICAGYRSEYNQQHACGWG
jgi:hypothetical protein